MTRGFLRFLRGNTIALLALFVALGGTTYAATRLPRNSVGAKQLKKNAVIAPKIKANAVNGAKIANDSVTGADVLESSLGKVPSAASADTAATATNADHATNSDKLGGTLATDYQHKLLGSCAKGAIEAIGSGGALACNYPVQAVSLSQAAGVPATGQDLGHGLHLTAVCHDGVVTKVIFDNNGFDTATLNWLYGDGSAVYANGAALAVTTGKDFPYVGGRVEGQFIWANGYGVTTVNLHAVDLTGSCEVKGTAEFGPG